MREGREGRRERREGWKGGEKGTEGGKEERKKVHPVYTGSYGSSIVNNVKDSITSDLITSLTLLEGGQK